MSDPLFHERLKREAAEKLVVLSSRFLTLAELERRHISDVLMGCKGNRTMAAKVLGIDRRTLGRKLKENGAPIIQPTEGAST